MGYIFFLMPSLTGIIFVTIAMLTWAFASVGYKYALGSSGTEKRDKYTSMAIRITMITIFLGILILFFGNYISFLALSPTLQLQYGLLGLITGILTIGGDICQFTSLRYLDSSRVYPLINTQILFTLPLAYFLLGDPIPNLMWIAAGLMICGVLFIGNPDNRDRGIDKLDVKTRRHNYIWGISAGIGTGLFCGIQYVTLAMAIRIFPYALEGNFVRLALYCVIIWPILLISKKHLPHIKTTEEKVEFRAYLIMGLVGCLSLGLGDTFYQTGVQYVGANLAIIIASSAPVCNQIFAILFLKEKFRWRFLIGVLLIVLGNILVII